MKHQVAASALGTGTDRGEGRRAGSAVAKRARSTAEKSTRTRTRAAPDAPNLVLASAPVWTHTLRLTGDLTHRSAHLLEAEIDQLCDEGVNCIRLDLRELTHIDSIGVIVLALRCSLCKRRGHDFVLIPGSRSVQRAFEQAGVTDVLPFQEDARAGSLMRTAHT